MEMKRLYTEIGDARLNTVLPNKIALSLELHQELSGNWDCAIGWFTVQKLPDIGVWGKPAPLRRRKP